MISWPHVQSTGGKSETRQERLRQTNNETVDTVKRRAMEREKIFANCNTEGGNFENNEELLQVDSKTIKNKQTN